MSRSRCSSCCLKFMNVSVLGSAFYVRGSGSGFAGSGSWFRVRPSGLGARGSGLGARKKLNRRTGMTNPNLNPERRTTNRSRTARLFRTRPMFATTRTDSERLTQCRTLRAHPNTATAREPDHTGAPALARVGGSLLGVVGSFRNRRDTRRSFGPIRGSNAVSRASKRSRFAA